MHPLDEARAKITRARQHLKALDYKVGRWTKSKPYRILEEYHAQTSEHRFSLRRRRDIPAERWGLVIGDCVHNTRSALDYLAWQLAGAKMGDRNAQFPIHFSPDSFKNNRGFERIHNMSDDAKAQILALQPYETFKTDPTRDLLYILNELDARDKHKLLTVATTAMLRPISRHLLTEATPGSAEFTIRRNHILLTDKNTVFAKYTADPPDRKVDMQFTITLLVAFGEGFPTKGGPYIVTFELKRMIDRAEQILNIFSAGWDKFTYAGT